MFVIALLDINLNFLAYTTWVRTRENCLELNKCTNWTLYYNGHKISYTYSIKFGMLSLFFYQQVKGALINVYSKCCISLEERRISNLKMYTLTKGSEYFQGDKISLLVSNTFFLGGKPAPQNPPLAQSWIRLWTQRKWYTTSGDVI